MIGSFLVTMIVCSNWAAMALSAVRRDQPSGPSTMRPAPVVRNGSIASTSPTPTAVVYSATKGAVDAITRVLAKELGPKKIRVNAINPGGVETEGVHSMGVIGSDFEKQMVARTPLGRLGQPDDIASVAVFLASAASGWITGETIAVGGGFS